MLLIGKPNINTNWNHSEEIKEAFKDLLTPETENDKLELETRLLMAQFLDGIEAAMHEKKMRKKDLAHLIGTSPSFITQIFRGNKVVNLETLCKISLALDLRFVVEIQHNAPGNKRARTYKLSDRIQKVAEK